MTDKATRAEIDRIRWGLSRSRSSKKAWTKKVSCPACGYKEATAIEEGTDKMDFECKQCTTEFSITFDTGEGRMKESYRLVKDTEARSLFEEVA